jgi:hypothetical protein
MTQQEVKHDPINNPSHYTDGGYETIDFIEKMQLGYHLGNAVKYISRAGKKTADPIEDLNKALWYLKRLMAIDVWESTLSPHWLEPEIIKYCSAKGMYYDYFNLLVLICSNDLTNAKKQLELIIATEESKVVRTQEERQKALRRIFSLIQLLNDDLLWFAKDKEVKFQLKHITSQCAKALLSFKVDASMLTNNKTWNFIYHDMTSEKIKDYHLLFDLAIQFKDVNEITTALEKLIKQQSNDTIH